MAGYAALVRYGARLARGGDRSGLDGRVRGGLLPGNDGVGIGGNGGVAAGTVGVVRRGFGRQLDVRIVASGTGKVSVVRVVTAAVKQSIRPEADITDAAEVGSLTRLTLKKLLRHDVN